jgi:hypothetical protein
MKILINILKKAFEQPQKEVVTFKENTIRDITHEHYQRIVKLRELVRRDTAEKVKRGEPYNLYKLNQADHLLREVTNRLNSRNVFHNRINMN